MKPNVVRGNGFRGALEYAMGHEKRPEIVASNMSGTNPSALSTEFSVARKLRPDAKKPVWHTSLSLPAGEHLDAARWQEIITNFLVGMGLDDSNHQFVAVRHNDTDYDHVHIVASRIGLDSALWHGTWEARKAIDLAQDLEHRHGLQRTQGYYQKNEKTLTANEINMAVRTGQEPPRQALQRLVKGAAQGNPTAPQFAERLKTAGVEVRANLASTGTLNGFSFGYGGQSFKSSQLGKKYSWKALQAQGVTYEQTRDREALEQFHRCAGSEAANADYFRFTANAGDDQQSVEPVPRYDRKTTKGISFEIFERYTTAPVESFAGLRRTDQRTIGASGGDQRSHGEAVRHDENRVQATTNCRSKDRSERGDDSENQPGGTKRQSVSTEKHTGTAKGKVAGSGDDRNNLDSVQLADHGRGFTDRYEITPERAQNTIDQAIRKRPAPKRYPETVSVSRLKRWFTEMKIKLNKVIDKAYDYFNDATASSAERAGWDAGEMRQAGLSGAIIDRLRALPTRRAANVQEFKENINRDSLIPVEVIQNQGIKLSNDVNFMVEKRDNSEPKTHAKPDSELPKIDLVDCFEDDEPSGPGIS